MMTGNQSKRNPFNFKGKSRQTTNLTAGSHESTQKLTSHQIYQKLCAEPQNEDIVKSLGETPQETAANSKGMQNSQRGSSLNQTGMPEQTSMNSGPEKYGKDFRMPELPPILQAQFFGDQQAAQVPQMYQQPPPSSTWF